MLMYRQTIFTSLSALGRDIEVVSKFKQRGCWNGQKWLLCKTIQNLKTCIYEVAVKANWTLYVPRLPHMPIFYQRCHWVEREMDKRVSWYQFLVESVPCLKTDHKDWHRSQLHTGTGTNFGTGTINGVGTSNGNGAYTRNGVVERDRDLWVFWQPDGKHYRVRHLLFISRKSPSMLHSREWVEPQY